LQIGARVAATPTPSEQSFLVLFFKKEPLPLFAQPNQIPVIFIAEPSPYRYTNDSDLSVAYFHGGFECAATRLSACSRLL
jgi:hypothetical protein